MSGQLSAFVKPSVTIQVVIDASTDNLAEVWIVPGLVPKPAGEHIDEHMAKRGICIHRGIDYTSQTADGMSSLSKLVDDIKAKFQEAGINVVVEETAND